MARTTQADRLGRRGEAFAAGYYRDRGAQILALNQRCGHDELDLIVREADGTVVFVEVKTRSSRDFGGAEAVTSAKLRRLRRAAAKWLEGRPSVAVRFDVLELTVVARDTGLAGEEHLLFDAECYQGVDDGARD